MLLRNKDKNALTEIFSSVSLPMEVWAYGSRVNGTAHDGSDLDLVIRTENLHQLPIDVLLDIKDKIRESNIPIVVELFDWARLPETFRRNIEAQYEVLFSNSDLVVNESLTRYVDGKDKKPGNPNRQKRS